MLLVSSLLLGLVGLAAAALSPGCGSAPTLKTSTQTITVGGVQRQFMIRVPLNYQNNMGYKLIYGLHWVGGRMDQVAYGGDLGSKGWKYFGLQDVAKETAIFVAPQGLNGGWPNTNDQDLKFIDAMNTYIGKGLCVDEGQRFSIGFSYGASMTYAIACARAKDFRAVAAIAGGVLSGCNGGNDPIAYFGIHGISDNTLSISGGRDLRDRFVRNNGCNSMAGAKQPAAGSRTHITTAATGCKMGYPVQWAAHDGGHIQAASDGPYPAENGNTSWVGPEVWKFYTLPELSKPR